MANEVIRNAARAAKVPLWLVGERAFNGLADSAFSRKLRHQLSAEDEAKALVAIDEIKREVGGDE